MSEFNRGLVKFALMLILASSAFAQPQASLSTPVQKPATINQQQGARQFFLRQLNVSGNSRTRLEVILRMIPLREGDLFDQAKWQQGLDALNQSGLFNPITQADYVLILDHALGVVDIELRVTEREYQRVDLNGGGGTSGGLSVGLDYAHANLTGRADKLLGRARVGDLERILVADYSSLIWTKRPMGLSLSGFYQRIEYVNTETAGAGRETLFEERTAGARIGFFVPLGQRRFALSAPSRVGLMYSISSSNLTDAFSLTSGAPASVSQEGLRIGSLTPMFVRDTRDRSFDPQKGELLTFGAELAARALGGSLNSVKPYFDYRRFVPVGKSVRERPVVAFGVRASHIAAFGQRFSGEALSTIDGVPLFKRSFVGGETQVRGYDPNSIAPLARVERFALTTGNPPTLLASEVRPIGGDTEILFNAEYRLPLVWRLSAAAFLDFGASVNARRLTEERFESSAQANSVALLTVVSPLSANEEQLPGYRISLGGELRLPIPILNTPIRLIFAVNPNAQRQTPASAFIAPEERFTFRIGFGRTL